MSGTCHTGRIKQVKKGFESRTFVVLASAPLNRIRLVGVKDIAEATAEFYA